MKKIKKYISLLKEVYKNSKHKKRNIAIFISSIFVLILFIHLAVSYGFYYNDSSISLLRSTVGDLRKNDSDYSLVVYLEDKDEHGEKTYRIGNKIPLIGYSYKKHSCKRNTELEYNDEEKTTSIILDKKEECEIFFDKVMEADIIVNIMLEEAHSNNTYIKGSKVPSYGYMYDKYTCKNDSIITYNNELHKYSISASKKDECNIYFKKVESDIIVNIFVETDNQEYNSVKYIPTNTKYNLNSSKSNCRNELSESILADILYEDGYIIINTTEVAICDVYLDRE